MASAIDAKTMIRAMGAGQKFLQLFQKAIEDCGGDSELLSLGTKDRFSQNMRTAARALVECDWRIPLSEMQNRSETQFRNDFVTHAHELPHARNFWWCEPLRKLGIPYKRFGTDPNGENRIVDNDLREALTINPVAHPWTVTYQDTLYIVCDLVTKNRDGYPKEGEFLTLEQIDEVSLVEARYFDSEN